MTCPMPAGQRQCGCVCVRTSSGALLRSVRIRVAGKGRQGRAHQIIAQCAFGLGRQGRIARGIGDGLCGDQTGRAYIARDAGKRAQQYCGYARALKFFGYRCAATGACASGAGKHRAEQA